MDGASNYLGDLYDQYYSSATAEADIQKIARAACEAVTATKASPETKRTVATVSVAAKLKYKGALVSFLKDYRDIDCILENTYHEKHEKFSSSIFVYG